MIDGVRATPVNLAVDERGRLLDLLCLGESDLPACGYVGMVTAYPGVVKAWRGHRRRTDCLVVIHGMAKVVLFDVREGSATCGQTDEFFLGIWNPVRLRIPPGVYHGFQCISTGEAMLIGLSDLPRGLQDPDEMSLPADAPEIGYDWTRK